MIELPFLAGLLAAGLTAIGIVVVRGYALRNKLLDHPNERSSHSTPTPRGAGLAIVVSLLVSASVITLAGASRDARLWIALAGVVPTAVVGWIDDRSSLPAKVRIVAHLLTAALVLPLALSASRASGAAAACLLAAWWMFAIVAAINVVNFMDGIDGIIGLQAAIFGLHLAALSDHVGTTAFALAFAGAASAFLLWNWHPAHIFMGDVGSGSLGALGMIGALLVLREDPARLLSIFLPLIPLFADATVTLLRRAKRGEKPYQAHREHLYQRLVSAGWGHAQVALLYGAMAAVGALVAQAADTAVWPLAVAAYVVALGLLGWGLESRVQRTSAA